KPLLIRLTTPQQPNTNNPKPTQTAARNHQQHPHKLRPTRQQRRIHAIHLSQHVTFNTAATLYFVALIFAIA
ncbi:hypothetical protein NSP24_24275, partial [Salmonella enterica]|nr:hypothetical protein [Salmonella enterica]